MDANYNLVNTLRAMIFFRPKYKIHSLGGKIATFMSKTTYAMDLNNRCLSSFVWSSIVVSQLFDIVTLRDIDDNAFKTMMFEVILF